MVSLSVCRKPHCPSSGRPRRRRWPWGTGWTWCFISSEWGSTTWTMISSPEIWKRHKGKLTYLSNHYMSSTGNSSGKIESPESHRWPFAIGFFLPLVSFVGNGCWPGETPQMVELESQVLPVPWTASAVPWSLTGPCLA